MFDFCLFILNDLSWFDQANKAGSLSSTPLPILHEGGPHRGLLPVPGILQERHHGSNGESLWGQR